MARESVSFDTEAERVNNHEDKYEYHIINNEFDKIVQISTIGSNNRFNICVKDNPS